MTDVRTRTPRVIPDLGNDPRLRASVDRLLRSDYEVGKVVEETARSDWPGDLAGRLLLSLSRYARVEAGTAARAEQLSEALLVALEERGYFGPPLREPVDEQQVAGHGWLVAGLFQQFHNTEDARFQVAAVRVVDELIVPALASLDHYPRERDEASEAGEASGTALTTLNGWLVSTDTWCILLSLNALVPAALETGREDLDELILILARTLSEIDLRAEKVQLHASLAAGRALADYGNETGSGWLLDVARSVYETYVESARTLNYATYNWFGRPESWTEPCAIVDSLGLAYSLAEAFGDAKYLEDARRIAHSALGYSERADGSFGLDSIATGSRPIIQIIEPDAHWCCTMRGAIGLLEAREAAVRFDDVRRIVEINDFYAGEIRLGSDGRVVKISTSYPANPAVDAKPVGAGASATDDHPSWSIALAAGAPTPLPERGSLALEAALPDTTVALPNGGFTRFHGPVIVARSVTSPDETLPLTDFIGRVEQGAWPALRLTVD